MNFLILFAFCLGADAEVISTGLTTTFGTDLLKNTIGPIEENDTPASRQRVSSFAQMTGAGIRTNEPEVTNDENIVRVCSLNDRTCIRTFFSENSDCKQAFGPVKDPVRLAQNTAFFSTVNITSSFGNFTFRGLSSATIIELNYNSETKNLVFAFEVKNANLTSKNTLFSYHRVARESIVLNDTFTIFFKSLIFTAVIPRIPDLRLDLAQIHVYIPEMCPSVTLGPNLCNSKHPDVVESYNGVYSSISVISREIFLLLGPLLGAAFIQDSVCDFGIEIFSV